MKMLSTLMIASTLTLSMNASAGCFGSGAFVTCSDSSGNNYNINRSGNTTMMNGYNSSTGSTWNQTSRTMGNMTFNSGRASNGNTWNTTRQDFGNGNYMINGTDSNGRSVNKSCFFGVCN